MGGFSCGTDGGFSQEPSISFSAGLGSRRGFSCFLERAERGLVGNGMGNGSGPKVWRGCLLCDASGWSESCSRVGQEGGGAHGIYFIDLGLRGVGGGMGGGGISFGEG